MFKDSNPYFKTLNSRKKQQANKKRFAFQTHNVNNTQKTRAHIVFPSPKEEEVFPPEKKKKKKA